MGQTIDLPAGWARGYGQFNADSAMSDGVYVHTKKQLMVRLDYTVEGFRGYQYHQSEQPARSFSAWAASGSFWAPIDGPVFDDPITCIVWLEVSGG